MNLVSAMLKESANEKETPFGHCLLSTGLTTLNVALSGEPLCGIPAGSVVWITGPPDSGKTCFAFTLFAEANLNASFRRHRFYLNDAESARHKIGRVFGSVLEKRVVHLEDKTHTTFWDRIRKIPVPFVYVLDSIDGLQGDDGWKVNNQNAKETFDKVRETGSILVFCSQEKIAEQRKVAAGGSAVPFYADYLFRTEYVSSITEKVGKKYREIGVDTTLTVLKSPKEPKFRTIPIPIFADHGYSNVEAIFSFLLAKKKIRPIDGGRFCWKDMTITDSRTGILNYIESMELLMGNYIKCFK